MLCPDVDARAERAIVRWGYRAYCDGWFPMGDEDTGEVDWVRPESRSVLKLVDFHVSRSLAKTIRQGKFKITFDQCFHRVIEGCALPRADDGVWLVEGVKRLFQGFHRAGLAHSVEAWLGDELVGGVYGLRLGKVFAGESMFSVPERGGTDASKVALAALVARLRERGFELFDAQLLNDHTSRFGFAEISDEDYVSELKRLRDMDCGF
jgi:leucyl/phenylalanyl-tRNA---protein transferase